VLKRDTVTGDWRKLYNEQFTEIVQMIKSRRVR
jgi:hypothetical protein